MPSKKNPGSIRTGKGSSQGIPAQDPLVLIGSGISSIGAPRSIGQIGNVPPGGTLTSARSGVGVLADRGLEGLTDHIADPNAHNIVPTVEALVEDLNFDGAGNPPLPVQTLGQAVEKLVGAVEREPPYIGQWAPHTTFTSIPDWGILKLNDSDLKSRGLLESENDPEDIFPYYYRTPSPPRDTEFSVPGSDPATDPLWNSGISSGILPGAGQGETYAGAFTRDGTMTNQPVMRTVRIMGQPTDKRQAIVVSGSFYPADRGVLALIHWPADGDMSDFLAQPLLDRCIAAILLGQGVTDLPVSPGSVGDPCIKVVTSIGGTAESPLADGDAGGIFAPGTDGDGNYNPFEFPGYSTGQYDLREIVEGFAADGTPLKAPWNDWDQDASNGARRYAGSFMPGPGQVRLGTDPSANDVGDHAPVQPYGIPVLGAGALLYDPIPATFVDGYRVIEGLGGIANTVIWEDSPEDQDKNFFGYRLPVLQDYTAGTGLKWTPRGENPKATKETARYFVPKEPNSGQGLDSGTLPTAGNYSKFPEDFWGWQIARYRHTFLLPEAVGAHPPSTDDFKVQHVVTSIPNGTSKTLLANLDFDTFDVDHTIILISGVTQQGSGPATLPLEAADVTVTAIPNAEGNQIYLTRLGSAGTTAVNLVLIEYTGPEGGENEFIVRSRDVRLAGSSTTWAPENAFSDVDKGVVFSAGTKNNGSSAAPTNWNAHLARAWVRVDGMIEAEYSATVPALSEFAWQAVEFTGSAWHIGAVALSPTSVYPTPTTAVIGDTFDPAHTWVYTTLKSDTGDAAEQGCRAYLNGAGTDVSLEVATTDTGKTAQIWFLENPYLTVQSVFEDARAAGAYTFQLVDGVDFTGVPDRSRAWPWATGFTPAAAAAQELDALWAIALTDKDTVTLSRESNGAALHYALQLMSFDGTKATLPAARTEIGTYQLLHFRREADFEALVRDGIPPNHPVDGYDLYGSYLLDPHPSDPENDGNVVNDETDPNVFSPFGPAPDYGFSAMPYHGLRSTIVIDSLWTKDPSDMPGGIDTAEWSWSSASTAGDPHVMWVSGVRYLVPRRVDNGGLSFEFDVDITGSRFWYTYRTEDNELTGDPQAAPAVISSPSPMFLGVAPLSFENDPVTGDPTYDPQGLTNTWGTRTQRLEFPFSLMGSNGAGNFSETNGPQAVDAITVATGANSVLLIGDMENPSFSTDARPRVFTRRPLAHRDADGSALPFDFAEGHGVGLIEAVNPKRLLFHSSRFSDAGDRGAFGNFRDPGNLPKGYPELFTVAKDGWERFLDESYRYAGLFLAVDPAQANQLIGPGMQSWVGGLIPIPVRAGFTSVTGFEDDSWLQLAAHESTLSLFLEPMLQVGGLPQRNPPLSDGAKYPFPSSGILLYPQTDYSTGFRPSAADGDIPDAQPDYSLIVAVGGLRTFDRVFDAAWSHASNPADVSGQPFLTIRVDGLTLEDFQWRPSSEPGGLSQTGIAILVKVPGLTTWMDLGRRDGSGPSKQDALLDGAGCQVKGPETFNGVDPETGLVYAQVRVNVGPYANLTKVLTGENVGEVPVMVRVLMNERAADYTLDRRATSPGEFESFAGPGVSSSLVRGLTGIRVVRTDGQVTEP